LACILSVNKFGRDTNITEETLLEFVKVSTQLICETGSQDIILEEKKI
jgi:hypothetical protein